MDKKYWLSSIATISKYCQLTTNYWNGNLGFRQKRL